MNKQPKHRADKLDNTDNKTPQSDTTTGAGEQANSAEADLEQPAVDLPEESIPDVGIDQQEDSEQLDVAQLQQQLTLVEQQRAEASDQLLRTQAELQNIQRRAQRDVANAHKFGLEKFANDLLPVVDTLERALEAHDAKDQQANTAIQQGLQLTLKMFLDTLAKHKVETIDPTGHPFDPQLHQAMSTQENSEVEPNTVVAVMQKGYCLTGRLLRPAMVVVAKAPAEQSKDSATPFDQPKIDQHT
jgi:molecular chaperone GrpE